MNRWEQFGQDFPEILAYLLGQVSHKFVADHRLKDLITLVNSIPNEEDDATEVDETIIPKDDVLETDILVYLHRVAQFNPYPNNTRSTDSIHEALDRKVTPSWLDFVLGRMWISGKIEQISVGTDLFWRYIDTPDNAVLVSSHVESSAPAIDEYTVHEFEHAIDGVFPSHEIRNSQGDVVIYGDKHRAPVYAGVLNKETTAFRNRINAMAEAIRNARIELFQSRAWNTEAYKFLSGVDTEPIKGEAALGVTTDKDGFRAGWDEAVFHYDIDEDAHNLPGASAGQVNAQPTEALEYPFAPYWYQFDANTGKYFVLTEGRRQVVMGNREGVKVMEKVLNTETARLRSDLAKADQQSSAIAATANELREQLALAEMAIAQTHSINLMLMKRIELAHEAANSGEIREAIDYLDGKLPIENQSDTDKEQQS